MEGSSHEARLVQMWTHGSFFSRLAEARSGHGRRSAFWKRMQELPLLIS
jgi:hypothetical protein